LALHRLPKDMVRHGLAKAAGLALDRSRQYGAARSDLGRAEGTTVEDLSSHAFKERHSASQLQRPARAGRQTWSATNGAALRKAQASSPMLC
jgi:hypothetical protein